MAMNDLRESKVLHSCTTTSFGLVFSLLTVIVSRKLKQTTTLLNIYKKKKIRQLYTIPVARVAMATLQFILASTKMLSPTVQSPDRYQVNHVSATKFSVLITEKDSITSPPVGIKRKLRRDDQTPDQNAISRPNISSDTTLVDRHVQFVETKGSTISSRLKKILPTKFPSSLSFI